MHTQDKIAAACVRWQHEPTENLDLTITAVTRNKTVCCWAPHANTNTGILPRTAAHATRYHAPVDLALFKGNENPCARNQHRCHAAGACFRVSLPYQAYGTCYICCAPVRQRTVGGWVGDNVQGPCRGLTMCKVPAEG